LTQESATAGAITVLWLPQKKSLIFNLLFGGDLGWGEIYTYKIQFVTKK
jgi:hypothetical protein